MRERYLGNEQHGKRVELPAKPVKGSVRHDINSVNDGTKANMLHGPDHKGKKQLPGFTGLQHEMNPFGFYYSIYS